MAYNSPEKKLAHDRAYRASHRKQLAASAKKYRESHREQMRVRDALRRVTHKEEIAAQNKAYQGANKERIAARARARYLAHREEINAGARARRAANPEKYREKFRASYAAYKERGIALARKRNYGLSEIAYNNLFAAQGNVCAICRTSNWGQRGPHVDHNHVTRKVRGILCRRCNTAIGMLGDNIEVLRSAVGYLAKTD